MAEATSAWDCKGPKVSQLEVRVLRDPMLGFPDESPGAMAIASPQTWDELTPQLRGRPDVELLEYEIEPGDVARLAQALSSCGLTSPRSAPVCP